jgi:hypothetical protein
LKLSDLRPGVAFAQAHAHDLAVLRRVHEREVGVEGISAERLRGVIRVDESLPARFGVESHGHCIGCAEGAERQCRDTYFSGYCGGVHGRILAE